MRILLVEPDEYYHHQFSRNLADLGELVIVPEAVKTLPLLKQYQPDVLVMELALPDVPGYELLEQIRARQSFALLPIIIFSEINTLQDLEAALGLGVNGYLVKGQDSINDLRKLLLTYSF